MRFFSHLLLLQLAYETLKVPLLVLLFKCSLESHLYQEQLNHCFLPLCHHCSFLEVTISLLSIYPVPECTALCVPDISQLQSAGGAISGAEHRVLLFFFLVSFRLKWHTETVLCWQRRWAPPSPGACQCHHQGATSYHMQTGPPAYPVSFLCLKALFGIPKGDESHGRLWKLLTHRVYLWFPLPPLAVRDSTRVMYACIRSLPKWHNYSARLVWKEILRDPHDTHKMHTQIFTDCKGRCFWIFSYKKIAEFLQ